MFDDLSKEDETYQIEYSINDWQERFFEYYNEVLEKKFEDETLKYEIDISGIEDDEKVQLKEILETEYKQSRQRIVDNFFNNNAKKVDREVWRDVLRAFILRIAIDVEMVDRNSFIFAKSSLGAGSDTDRIFAGEWEDVQRMIDPFIAK